MKSKIEFIPEAAEDYRRLDGSIKKIANKKINELEKNPHIGERPGNRFNINLTGFYKIYFYNKKFRIVYRIINDVIEIIEIWGIGKRDKEEIYKMIKKRLEE
jgi:mRNA interferase RelE/StbE